MRKLKELNSEEKEELELIEKKIRKLNREAAKLKKSYKEKHMEAFTLKVKSNNIKFV